MPGILRPLRYQESYDNAGLLVGDRNQPVNGVLICLDSTEGCSGGSDPARM